MFAQVWEIAVLFTTLWNFMEETIYLFIEKKWKRKNIYTWNYCVIAASNGFQHLNDSQTDVFYLWVTI